MKFRNRCVACFAAVLLFGPLTESHSSEPVAATSEQIEFFEKQIRPILAEHCYSCHSTTSEKLQANLLLDSRHAMLAGGDSGEAIVPGDANGSMLIEAVRYESYEMPPEGKLPDAQIAALAAWVEMGAPWPAEEAPSGSTSVEVFDLAKRRSQHWVWQQIQSHGVPDVIDQEWPVSELDCFILEGLEENGLRPAPDVDRRGLARRLYFDLVGLPPTPAELAKFLADKSPNAVESLVDGLLASPHFGERWGRHWLDVVRYAESRGHEFDNDAPNAFQYRDYVIRTLNADVPYHQFVREHIAGDLLNEPRLNSQLGFNESILATGFWFLGEWVHSPVDIRKDEFDRFDNMIDVMSKAFLGVTVSCARCHDHKFDAISTADYYSLTGFLQSSDYRQVRFESLEQNRQVAARLDQIDTKYRASIAEELQRLGIDRPGFSSSEPSSSIVVDYDAISADDYVQDGFIFGASPVRKGQLQLAKSAYMWKVQFAGRSAAKNDPFWHGLRSISETGQQNRSELAKLPRSGRTLRTPSFLLEKGKVHCRVRGEGHLFACVDSHQMVAGPLHGETIVPVREDQQWVELNLDRYVGHRLHIECTPKKGRQLEIALITQGASDDELQSIEHREQVDVELVRHTNLTLEDLLQDSSGKSERLRLLVNAWAGERAALQDNVVRKSRRAMAMLDGTSEDGHVLIRGNASKPSDLVPRRFLTAVAGDSPMSIAKGSGRLQLASAINDASNPLTTRVMVNRIWHYLMGRGIVPTTDDFGVLGQLPTHPELLDYLATKFVEDGQSIKAMIKRIVLSRTYQMSSLANAAAVQQDPKNLLWHHRPPKRLEGEVIRDSLLSVSGSLDRTQFGEPVPVHLTDFMDGRGRPVRDGPLNGGGRRSIYLAVRRNFLSPFMLAFDTPSPFSTMGRRNVSNVPAQSLILMNHPLVVECASKWAASSLSKDVEPEERVRGMYEAAFAREPTQSELDAAVEFLNRPVSADKDESDELEVWADFAHALINTKEFSFLR